MQLSIRDVSRLLSVPEKILLSWIAKGDLPASRVNDQYSFNHSEVLEWATARKLKVAPGIFEEKNSSLPALSLALEAGGILHHVRGKDPESVFKAVDRKSVV